MSHDWEVMKKQAAQLKEIVRQHRLDIVITTIQPPYPPGYRPPRIKWPWEDGPIIIDYMPMSNRSTS